MQGGDVDVIRPHDTDEGSHRTPRRNGHLRGLLAPVGHPLLDPGLGVGRRKRIRNPEGVARNVGDPEVLDKGLPFLPLDAGEKNPPSKRNTCTARQRSVRGEGEQ